MMKRVYAIVVTNFGLSKLININDGNMDVYTLLVNSDKNVVTHFSILNTNFPFISPHMIIKRGD